MIVRIGWHNGDFKDVIGLVNVLGNDIYFYL